MSIIVSSLLAPARLSHEGGVLCVHFTDPAYVHSEEVVIDRASRMVGVVFAQGWHAVGELPAGIALKGLDLARLSGEAHELMLSAPVRFHN